MIYSSVVGFILLVAAIGLMLWQEWHVANSKKPTDRRVVNFILWLALAFGIGATVIGTLIVLSQLKVIIS